MTAPDAEGLQWCEQGCDEPEMHARCSGADAWTLTTWISNNDGEARYRPGYTIHRETGQSTTDPPRILIRQRDGSEAACSPGQWVMKGSYWFDVDSGAGLVQIIKTIREFTVESR